MNGEWQRWPCKVRYVDDVLRADDDSAYLAYVVDWQLGACFKSHSLSSRTLHSFREDRFSGKQTACTFWLRKGEIRDSKARNPPLDPGQITHLPRPVAHGLGMIHWLTGQELN